MPIFRGSTSRGAHVRALWEAITAIIEDLPEVPTERRVRLRTLRAALERSYPGELGVNEVALMQQGAEDDGEAIHD